MALSLLSFILVAEEGLCIIREHKLHEKMIFLSQSQAPSSCRAIIFSFLVALCCHGNEAALVLPNNETVPAVLVFGDSIVDPGNNNNLNTIAKSNFPPYGRDFEGGPTGRFSNGKVPSDLIAEEFGVKELVPAYLDPSLQLEDLLTGVSFASGAAGYDPIAAKISNVLSTSDQLDLFEQYKTKIKSAVGEERAATIISKAIYIVVFGSNDVANIYFGTPIRRTHYDFNSYTDFTVSYASKFLQELYGLGARRIGVLGLPPIGCVPSQRTLGGGPNRDCYKGENQLASLYNAKLSGMIDSLRTSLNLPGTKLIFLDIYYPLLSLIQNAAKYGFEVTNKGCCGTGLIEASILCNPLSIPKSCPDASKYVFWDGYHPSDKAYKILVPIILNMHLNEFF
ncbi:GDSL-like Lipase/Acylhydrolase superfamily protein, putative isoform 1 [Theobroma cacao]|uniref:GDSL-like Lipase/Acylhydrolase superfamily protein, putative isoform 1 n=1 Tax=Theobroma cacao TaxID=3641 RepID=A0A061DFN3_THECC|nr:GDSL-like Lipase/Acylhydrolase superfamily protein, putative isoform 1 [Theobroma cacao]